MATVAESVESFFGRMPRPRPRGAAAQLALIQEAVDRGWARLPDSPSSPAAGDLCEGADQVFRIYCREVARRPAVAVTFTHRPLTGAALRRVLIRGLTGPHHALPGEGWRALATLCAGAAAVDDGDGMQLDIQGTDGYFGGVAVVTVDADELPGFLDALQDFFAVRLVPREGPEG